MGKAKILLDTKKNKTGRRLRLCLELLKKDKELKTTEMALKQGWRDWNKLA